MATPYSALTLCSLADLNARLQSLPFASKDSSSFQKSANDKLPLVKERIRKKLQVWLKHQEPDSTEAWATYWSHLFRDRRKQLLDEMSLTASNSIAQFPSGELVDFNVQDFLQAGEDTTPEFFFRSTPPGALEYAGAADNGAMCLDMTHSRAYQNTGTLTAPVWSLFDAKSLIDNILNPTELNMPAVTCWIWLLLDEGLLKLKAEGNDGYDWLAKTKVAYKTQFEEELEESLELLEIDASGDGILSDDEAQIGASNNWIF